MNVALVLTERHLCFIHVKEDQLKTGHGRQDSLVHLASLAQAAVVPALADAAEGAAQRLREPLAGRSA
jgi:hypothetical protein